VKDTELSLLDRDTQLSGKTQLCTMTIGQAVEQKVVDNETLGISLSE
jgi:glycyl-tRNA synthetase